jgi:hypothetical protein
VEAKEGAFYYKPESRKASVANRQKQYNDSMSYAQMRRPNASVTSTGAAVDKKSTGPAVDRKKVKVASAFYLKNVASAAYF